MELKDKVIACTGASGYLGMALLKRLSAMECKEIRCFDHNEQMSVKVQKEFPDTKWIIGDIKDNFKVWELVNGADVVLHLCAQKHIPVAEKQPSLAIDSNILGSANVAMQSIVAKVPVVLGISTDKACKPQTIYGMTKYFMERLFQEYNEQNLGTKFLTVRYGNVAASSGSVFELWDKKGRAGEVIEVSDPEMTRFYWTVEEAVDLIFEALEKQQLTPLIPKMKAMKLGDIAEVFSEHYKVSYKITGNRGNEKIHEDLDEGITSDKVERFTKEEIQEFLIKLGLLK